MKTSIQFFEVILVDCFTQLGKAFIQRDALEATKHTEIKLVISIQSRQSFLIVKRRGCVKVYVAVDLVVVLAAGSLVVLLHF